MLGRFRPVLPLLLCGTVALLLVAGLPPAVEGAPFMPSGPSSGVFISLGAAGTLTADLSTVVSNGSALRYAMDGNFTPLIDELPGTNASRQALLHNISAIEGNPVFAGLFGDHDGRVDDLVDIPHFASLINYSARLIPVSTFTGLLNVTLDGKAPTSVTFQGVSFSNAAGPDSSTAPIGLTATLGAAFSWSGVGNAHTFETTWNLPSILGNLTLPVQSVQLSFTTPTGTTITSVTGLANSQVSNDALGWGAASASGEYTPLPGHDVVVKFGPSFPTGDAVIIGAVVVAGGVGTGWLLLRRRRGRRGSAVPPPGPSAAPDSGVGPSSGSG